MSKPRIVSGLRLVETSREESPRFGRFQRVRSEPLITYDVFDGDRKIGNVRRDMATFETSSRGRTYVNSRWQSPRWFAARADSMNYRHHHDTLTAAVEELKRSIDAALKEKPE